MWPGLVHASSECLDQSAIRGVTLHGTIHQSRRTTRTGPTARSGRRIPSFLVNGRQMVAANQSLAKVVGNGASGERHSATSDSGVSQRTVTLSDRVLFCCHRMCLISWLVLEGTGKCYKSISVQQTASGLFADIHSRPVQRLH